MSYFRRVDFKDTSGTVLETFQVDSIAAFFREFVYRVENFVSTSTAVKTFDYFAGTDPDEFTQPLIRTGFEPGSFSGVLFLIISDPAFIWLDQLPDPLETIRNGSSEEKAEWFSRLWKNRDWRDVHTILHTGK